jgi:pyroglutamyl-peptidase
MKILLTGFETFGDNPINASQRLVEALPNTLNENIHLQKLILPVDEKLAPEIVLQAINEGKPNGVMAFGLAAGRTDISIERVAINLMDFQIPDNTGASISNEAVVSNGPEAYFSTLPVRKMLNKLTNARIPASLSLSAGAFLCNQVFYSIMHEIDINKWGIPAGFIHLPTLPEGAAKNKKPIPSMSLDLMLEAAKIMITCLYEEITLLNNEPK